MKNQEIFELMEKLISNKFRFTLIHNPQEKKMQIVSATQCDLIKHKFPEFNIYLSGNNKIVEYIYFYS